MRNIAVILAGGAGNRMNSTVPKQFLEIAGKPMIAYSIDAFEQHSGVDEIVVVIHPAYFDIWESIVAKYNWKKVKKVLEGGDQRSDSTLVALQAYAGVDEAHILFHDAARPLVSQRIISDTLKALEQFKAVTVAVPTADTIFQTDNSQIVIARIPSRAFLRRMQTPQGFHLSTIKQAYALAADDPYFTVTDDCGVVHKYLPNEKIGLVEGEENNFKITYPQDITLMETIILN